MEKRRLSDDVFTSPIEAVMRAMDLGMGPAAHVYERDGEVTYMPGASHDAYVEHVGGEYVAPSGAEDSTMEAALRAVVREIMGKGLVKARIMKADDEQRMAYGWASVWSVDGEVLVDRQGDIISPRVGERAATKFMMELRTAKAMHEGNKIGEVVHSMPITDEIAAAFNLKSSMEGWMVGVKIYDGDVWSRVKSGNLRAFSIGGHVTRREVDG